MSNTKKLISLVIFASILGNGVVLSKARIERNEGSSTLRRKPTACKFNPVSAYIPGKENVLNIPHVTGADVLHSKGINGRGTTIAYVGLGFGPQYMQHLIENGVVHPAALQEKTFISQDEHLERVNLSELRGRSTLIPLSDYDPWHSDDAAPSPGQQNRYRKQHEETQALIHRKEVFDYIVDSTISCSNKDPQSGPITLDTFHLVAPQAKVLPIDVSVVGVDSWERAPDNNNRLRRPSHIDFEKIIQLAIKHNVDAMFFDISIIEGIYNYIDSFKEAARKGIAFIIGDSSVPYHTWGAAYTPIVGSKKKLLQQLDEKGILYVYSLCYLRGELSVEGAHDHANENLLSHVVFAPGNHIPIFSIYKTPHGAEFNSGCGDNLATSIVSAGFANLKQFAKEAGVPHTSHDLLRILHDSAYDFQYSPGYGQTHKILDLESALELAKIRFKQNSIKQPTSTHVAKRSVSSPVSSTQVRKPQSFIARVAPRQATSRPTLSRATKVTTAITPKAQGRVPQKPATKQVTRQTTSHITTPRARKAAAPAAPRTQTRAPQKPITRMNTKQSTSRLTSSRHTKAATPIILRKQTRAPQKPLAQNNHRQGTYRSTISRTAKVTRPTASGRTRTPQKAACIRRQSTVSLRASRNITIKAPRTSKIQTSDRRGPTI